MSARLLGLLFKVNGKYLGKVYKQHLSGFSTWEQRPHAKRWMLEPGNVGERLSIDETSFSHGELYTIVSNKAGHGRRKSLVAVVEGTLASKVSERLLQLPLDRRLGVREVTMDFSDGMFGIVRTAFPSATIVIDCFHIMKRAGEGLEEMRLKLKRECRAEIRRQEREFRKKLRLSWKRRQAYLKAHPGKYPGSKRGRKPLSQNSVFVPEKLPNGETTVELLTRIRYPLCKCCDDWTASQKARMKLLFERFPRLEIAYRLVERLRTIFRKRQSREEAARELLEWKRAVGKSPIRELIAVRNTIDSKEEYVLNYFLNRSTNASAESLNSKIKGLRAQQRGVSDRTFFMFRLHKALG